MSAVWDLLERLRTAADAVEVDDLRTELQEVHADLLAAIDPEPSLFDEPESAPPFGEARAEPA